MTESFITIAVFQYSSEAHIIKGKLEAEGIEVIMFDNLTIDTDPLVSNAIGGVKLKVHASQEQKARGVLNSINEFSLNDDGKKIVCPNCESTRVYLFSSVREGKSMFWFLMGLLLTSLPFYAKHRYNCQDCKHEFDLK